MALSTLSSILAAANSGLRASQVGLDVVSRNVANASTVGYTRKSVPLESLVVGGQGQGVRTGEVERVVNASLMKEIRKGLSTGEALRAREDFLARLELAFGTPGDESSISAMLGQVGDAFRGLVAQPESAVQRQTVLAKAAQFARSANDLNDTIQNLRLDAEQQVKGAVDGINTVLGQIDELNRQIIQARAQQQSTADLQDKRDVLLDKLGKELDITSFERDSGEIWIMTGAGRQLLDGDPHSLSFNANSAINASMTYAGGPSRALSWTGST